MDKEQRRNSIHEISGYAPFKGKSPELTQKLYSRLEKGEIQAITQYHEAYQIKQPDSNLIDTLQNIPWEGNILIFVGATIAGKGLQSLIVSLPFIINQHPDTHLVIVGSGASREFFELLLLRPVDYLLIALAVLIWAGVLLFIWRQSIFEQWLGIEDAAKP